MLKIKIKTKENKFHPLVTGIRYKFSDDKSGQWVYLNKTWVDEGRVWIAFMMYHENGDVYESSGLLEREISWVESGTYIPVNKT